MRGVRLHKNRRKVKPDALREVTSKSEAVIEHETALKWAARAAACRQCYDETGNEAWLLRAENYKHEALEHAALVNDNCRTLRKIERELAGMGREVHRYSKRSK